MVFDMKGKSEASFLHGVGILIFSCFPATTGYQWADNVTETLRASRGAICSIHMSLKSCFLLFKHYSLTVVRKQSPWEEESSQEKMEQSEKEWK